MGSSRKPADVETPAMTLDVGKLEKLWREAVRRPWSGIDDAVSNLSFAQFQHHEAFIVAAENAMPALLVREAAYHARGDLIHKQEREIAQLREALQQMKPELFCCAMQLGCNWKDREWRERSSVGRAYDKACAALSASSP